MKTFLPKLPTQWITRHTENRRVCFEYLPVCVRLSYAVHVGGVTHYLVFVRLSMLSMHRGQTQVISIARLAVSDKRHQFCDAHHCCMSTLLAITSI